MEALAAGMVAFVAANMIHASEPIRWVIGISVWVALAIASTLKH